MRRLLLALAVIAGPVCAQDSALETVADGLAVSDPEMLMRAALANCIAYDFDTAIARIAAAGWTQDTDDGGLTTLWLDDTYAMINPDEGFCSVQSSVVPMERATYVAGDLMTTTYGGTAFTETDDNGCGVVSTDANVEDYIAISGDGNDPVCEDTGEGGSALTYYSY